MFTLADRRGVRLRDDLVDLVREAVDRFVEADQVFRRRQGAQRVAHFGQTMLDARQRVAIDAANIAGLAAFGDALGQALNLPLDGVDRLARHRLVERLADVAEFGAQGIDGVLDAGAAQGLDLVGDLAQVFFEAGQVLTRRRHHHRRRDVDLRMRRRIGLHLGRHRLLRRAAIERALTRGDFGHRAVKAWRRHDRRHLWRHRRHHRRRHRRCRHQARNRGDLLDALIQPRDQLRQLRGFAALRLAGRRGPGCLGRLGRCAARELFDAAGNVVQPLMHAGQFVAIGIVIVAIGRAVRAVFFGLLQDHGIQPFAQRHAGAARRFLCSLAGFRPYAFHTPRDGKFHSHTHSRGGGAESLDRLSWNRRAHTGRKAGRSSVHRPTFCRSR